ncbi:kinase-like protein, partial [Mycena sanguinolenta]
LQFLGANTFDDKPFIVMPFMSNNAREFLRKRPDFDPVYILRDVSLGLAYLHLHPRKICHGDLKGASINILVDDSSRALLCDFGLARVRADVNSCITRVGDTAILGSRNWMAPEVLTGSLPKLPSDIYAFGMTLYEVRRLCYESQVYFLPFPLTLYTDEIPYSNLAYGDFVDLVFLRGLRPDRPDTDDSPKLTDRLWKLAERCWVQDPKARPTAPAI